MAANGLRASEDNAAVLVTGASGYLGSSLVRYLAEMGQTVVSMYRHRIPEPCSGVFPVCSDLSSPELLAAHLRGVHTVVHLAWEKTFTGPESLPADPELPAEEVLTENLRSTKTLLQAMLTAGTRRMIFISAMGAERKTDNLFLREKYLAEFYVLNAGLSEIIILRPSVIFGGEDSRNRFIQAVRRLMRLPGFYPVPSWKKPIYPLAVSDFSRVILGCINYKSAPGPYGIFDVSGQHGYQIEEIFRIISGKDGKGPRIPVNRFLGRTLLPFLEKNFGNTPDQTVIGSLLPVSGMALNDLAASSQLSSIYPGPYEAFAGIPLSEN